MSDLGPGALKLLKTIAKHDQGDGVEFEQASAGRWRMTGTTYAVNTRTFRLLDARGLVDVGDGFSDPVKLTEAGRECLRGEA